MSASTRVSAQVHELSRNARTDLARRLRECVQSQETGTIVRQAVDVLRAAQLQRPANQLGAFAQGNDPENVPGDEPGKPRRVTPTDRRVYYSAVRAYVLALADAIESM